MGAAASTVGGAVSALPRYKVRDPFSGHTTSLVPGKHKYSATQPVYKTDPVSGLPMPVSPNELAHGLNMESVTVENDGSQAPMGDVIDVEESDTQSIYVGMSLYELRTESVWTTVALSTWFENVALLVIILNALWIGVEVI